MLDSYYKKLKHGWTRWGERHSSKGMLKYCISIIMGVMGLLKQNVVTTPTTTSTQPNLTSTEVGYKNDQTLLVKCLKNYVVTDI